MGRGASKLGGSSPGVNSETFFGRGMGDQVNDFRAVVPDDINNGFQQYVYGMDGGAKKAIFDETHGLSDFIDSSAADPLRVSDNPVLYRGGTISDAEFQALEVGKPLNIMDSQNQLTSWSTREMVAHMYAEDSKNVWGQGGKKPHDVVIVDTSSTKDGIVYPYSYPANEVLRSRSRSYTVTKIVDASKYTKPIGRKNNESSDYYTNPVTYIYVKSR